MNDLSIRVTGFTERDARRWRRLVRPPVWGAHIVGWAVAGAAVVYSVDHYSVRIPLQRVDESTAVVATVPSLDSDSVPPCASPLFFMNQPYRGQAAFSLRVTDADGNESDLTEDSRLIRLVSDSGNTIVVLAPGRSYPTGAHVTASIRLRDEMRNQIVDASVQFKTRAGTPVDSTSPSTTFGQRLPFTGYGDFGITTTRGDVTPRSGSTMLAMSSGSVFGSGAAQGKTSMLSVGPFEPPAKLSVGGLRWPARRVSLQFDYDFISSEFDDYVDKGYDDAFLVILSGPRGAHAQMVTSVNQVGRERSTPVDFPGMPDEGRGEAPQHTGWQTISVTAETGSPVCLTFVITDVGDQVYTSTVTIDGIRFN